MIFALRTAASLLICFAFSFQAACGGALPPASDSSALHRDLERLVEVAQREGWDIDRMEVRGMLAPALLSLCQTRPEARLALSEWIDARIVSMGGPVEEAYARHGNDLDAVDALLSLSRIRMLLRSSMKAAEEDCPFWLHPKSEFKGEQLLDDRFILSLGGGGKGVLARQSARNELNFGGAGRILIGRGFGRHATIFTGLELGGSASFPENDLGQRTGPVIAIDLVTPLVYRHRLVNTYLEVEAGYVAHLTRGEIDPAHGFHVGIAIGASRSRLRWLFPGLAFGVGYNRIAEDQILHVVNFGFRLTFDLTQ